MLDLSNNSFYIGLKSYNQTTSSKFIGKDREVDSLLAILQTNKFVCLTGAEGSGKTSLLNAGLIPRLLAGFPGKVGNQWSICKFRPSASPLSNFKQALTFDGVLNLEDKPNTTDILDYDDVFSSMRELSLVSIYKNSEIYNKKNLLVVIDQVEDLFRFNKDFNHLESKDDDLLFDIAAKSVSYKTLPIYFVFSINSIFVSKLSQYPSLQELISQSQYAIQNLSLNTLKDIVYKGDFEVEATSYNSIYQIYELLSDDISYLPNLQFYLKLMKSENYKEDVTVENCIGQTFDLLFDKLQQDEKQKVKGLLFGVVNIETNSTHSFKATIDYIIQSSNITLSELKELLVMLSGFFDNLFEIVPNVKTAIYNQYKFNLKGNDFIKLNYSKYFNSKVFSDFVKEEEVSYRRFKEFTSSLKQYKIGESGLLTGPQLEIAKEWLINEKHTKEWAEKYVLPYADVVNFIKKSVTENERLIALADDKIKKEAKKNAFQKKLYAGFAIIALILTLFAANEWRIATKSQELAKKETKLAKAASKEALDSSKKAQEALKIAKQKEAEAKKAIEKEIAEKQLLLQSQRSDSLNKLRVETTLQTIEKDKKIREELLEEINIKNQLINIKNNASTLMIGLINAQKSGKSDQVNKAIKNLVSEELKFDSLNQLQPNIYISDDWMYDLNQKAWSMIEGKSDYHQTSMRLGEFSNYPIVDFELFNNQLVVLADTKGSIYITDITLNNIQSYASFNTQLPNEKIKRIGLKKPSIVVITTFTNKIYSYSLTTEEVSLLYETDQTFNNIILNVFYKSKNEEIIVVENKQIVFIKENGAIKKIKLDDDILAASFNKDKLYFILGNQLVFYDGVATAFENINLPKDLIGELNDVSVLHVQDNYLFMGFKSGEIKIYSINQENYSLKPILSHSKHFGEIVNIYFDQSKKALYTSGIDNRLFRYDFKYMESNLDKGFSKLTTPDESINKIQAYTNSLGQRMLMTIHDQKYLLSWHVDDIDMLKALNKKLIKNSN